MATYNLNEVQTKIINHTQGAVLVLAGAGSGKTSVLTHRIANILNSYLAMPHQILAITFTNKAANEMRSRLFNMGCPAGQIWAQTFHSFCARVLRLEADKLDGYNKNFTIYDEADKKLVLKKILKSKDLKEDAILNVVMHDISAYKNKNLSLQEFESQYSYRTNIGEVIDIMRQYEIIMKQNNALDFDDLLYKTLQLLKTNEEVRLKYQKQFKFILIDEFQDTNKVQYELVKVLSQYYNNIFAVGDEDQSIYSWRGANVENIQKFLHDFKDVTLYKLEQNYRSTKSIIDCANSVIKHNVNRIDKTLFTENEQGVRVEHQTKYTDKEEAEYVVQQIYTLTRQLGYEYKQIAVLMRLNALTRSFEDKLLSYDIPYQIFGGLKFYERAEIKNVLAYLKLLVNSKDNESFNRIVNFPKRNLGEVTVGKLMTVSNGKSLLETVLSLTDEQLEDKTFGKFFEFKKLMEDFIEKKSQLCVSELAQYIIDKLDLETVYKTDKQEDENRIYNLNELISSIEQFEDENGDISLEEYLQNVSLTTDLDTYDTATNCVTLATVHSAKGLEFDIVFVVGLEEQYFPLIRGDTMDSDIEEERRLIYVAVTRAKERLYLTNSSSRFMYGKTNYTIPSRFLGEMGFKKQSNTYEFKSYGQEKPKPMLYSYSTNQQKSTLTANTNTDYNNGDRVSHSKFGVGVVVDYQKSTDILVINFEGFGNKILSAKFAKLEKI